MSAEIQVPDGPEACGPTCAIQLLGVEVQHATKETEVTLPDRPALSCFGSGGQSGHHPSAYSHRGQSLRDPGWSKVTFDDQFFKAVGGEASWKTSDFDQAADRTTSTSREASRRRGQHLGAPGCQGTQRLLATVLFTDIVGSTERAPGGRRPAVAELLDHHDQGSPPAGRAARREADQEHRRWHPGGLRHPMVERHHRR